MLIMTTKSQIWHFAPCLEMGSFGCCDARRIGDLLEDVSSNVLISVETDLLFDLWLSCFPKVALKPLLILLDDIIPYP